MKVIGVTGGIGSGKSTVSRMFLKYGAEVVDADEISRSITKKNGAAYSEIVESFGGRILFQDGEIDRKKLAEIVFSDKSKLMLLNSITHKYVFFEMQKCIDESESEVIVLDVPLLFSSDFRIKCDYTIGVTADMKERILRVKQRDGMVEEDIMHRIENQISDEELREKADFIIENNIMEESEAMIERIMTIIRND